MEYQYPELEAHIAKRGIKISVMASALGISQRAFYNKRIGKSPFNWEEACKIQRVFFPDVEKDVLFRGKQDE